MSEIVSCSSGGCYAERPRSFFWQGEQLDVMRVVDSVRQTDRKSFLIQTDENRYFRLVYNFLEDAWQIDLI